MKLYCEHNTDEHQKLIDAHFANIEKGFWIGLKQPQQLSTFTLGDQKLLPLLKNTVTPLSTAFLVDNEHVQSLICELETKLPVLIQCFQDKWPQNKNIASYIAVWTDDQSSHSLVGVVNSVHCTLPHINTPCLKLSFWDGTSINGFFDELEELMRKKTTIPSDFFTIIGQQAYTENDPVQCLQQWATQWNFEDCFYEDRSKSLLLQAIDGWTEEWVAQQQKNLINEQLDNITQRARTRKIM